MVDFKAFMQELERFGKENLMYNVYRETGQNLYDEVKKSKSKSILEIGTSNGYSTIWLAKSCKGKIITIEKTKEKVMLAKENFEKLNLKNIKIMHGDALKIIPKLKCKFDFVFIDATKYEYLVYFLLVEKKLEKDFIVIADNVVSHKKKVKDFLNYVKKYKTEIKKIGIIKITP